MRKLIILSFFLLFFSCKSKVPVFELYKEVNFSITAGLDQIATHHILIHNISSSFNAKLSEKGLNASDISEFYAGKGKIVSVFNEANFGIIERISVWIYKKGEYNKAKEIYYRDEIPFSLRGEIKLLSTGEDVRDILSNDKYEMDIELKFKSFVTETIDCRFPYSFVAYSE